MKHKSFGTITNVTKIHPTSGKREEKRLGLGKGGVNVNLEVVS